MNIYAARATQVDFDNSGGVVLKAIHDAVLKRNCAGLVYFIGHNRDYIEAAAVAASLLSPRCRRRQ